MSGHPNFTSLEALPPFVGDAPVAAVLLRDLAASLTGTPGGVRATAVEVDDHGHFSLHATRATGTPIDTEHAPLAAPELFDGADADGRTDVYAAACLALTRYLGTSPIATPDLARRAPTKVRIGALRQAHRTSPAKLGAIPDPLRRVFAQAVAKQAHLRPTPAALVALLDAALAASGETVEADARVRVRRLVTLARIFVPVGPAAAAGVAPIVIREQRTPATSQSHLPLRALPSFARPGGVARVALIAAVAVLATGGVAVAAVVGLSGGSSPTPQAISTRGVTLPTSGSSSSAVATSSSSATSTTAPSAGAAVAPGAGAAAGGSGNGANNGSGNDGSAWTGGWNGGSGGSGSGGSGSGGSGSGSGGSGSGGSGSGGSGGGSHTPPTKTQPPRTTTPRPPSTPPSSTPVDPPTDTTPVDPPTDTTPVDPPTDTTPVDPPTETTAPPATESPSDVPTDQG